MEIIGVFAVVSIIIFLGYFAEQIFKKTNIPDVLILIIIGIIIGSGLKWIDAPTLGFGANLFTTFALIFILFQGSLNIDFRTLYFSLPKTFGLTILTFIFTVIIIALISMVIGFDILTSVLIGTILGGTSSAVVIPIVRSIPIDDKYALVLKIESALNDILCIVGTITVLEIMKTGEVMVGDIFRSILSIFALALVVGFFLGLMWVFLLYKFESLMNSYITSIAAMLCTYAFVESSWVNASGAIAAVAFGLALGNSRNLFLLTRERVTHHEKRTLHSALVPGAKNFYSELSFFVKTFFFVYMGILFDFSEPIIFLYAAMLTFGVFLIRPFIVKLVFRHQHIEQNNRVFLEVIMPKGLVAAVLAGIAVQSKLITNQLAHFSNIIFSTIFLTILATSLLIFLTERNLFSGFFPFLNKKEEK